MEQNSLPVSHSALANVLKQMGISDISHSTIRQSGSIARSLEKETGAEFLHLEMGIPGLPPSEVGVRAEKAALPSGPEGDWRGRGWGQAAVIRGRLIRG